MTHPAYYAIPDKIWLIGQAFRQKVRSPVDGEMLLVLWWYLNVLFPLFTLVVQWRGVRFLHAVVGFFLIMAPYFFVRWRYRGAVRVRLIGRIAEIKNPAASFGLFWVVVLIVAVVEATALITLGVWEVL